MKKLSTILLVLQTALCSHAQLNIYSALTIPDSLRKDADMVVREENIRLSIKDKNTARYEVHRVLTVMNEQAKKHLDFGWFSDKFDVLDDAEIKVYDISGNKRNTYSKKEMTSQNYGDGLVPEGKITYFYVNAPSYPITVEVSYSIKYKGILNLHEYEMQSPWQSVQHSVFEVEVPADLGVRYKLLNTNNQPEITHAGNKDIYHWEQQNKPAYKLEKHSGSSDAYMPQVLLAPNKFQLDDYDGDMTSWKNYGLWINELYARVSGFSEDKKLFYQGLVKNAGTDREKAAILYNYLQNNMRYVSIQLGIGGLRPFPASFVDEKKYGDCKALSNYLKSALDVVGIKSNLIIIYRDYEAKIVDEKFPMNDFNHVILCIPQLKDSIWLECTSTSLPFANLDETTLSRKGVMITDNGGVLVNTPVSNYESNTESINTLIEVNEGGGAKVKINYTLYGDGRDDMLRYYHDLKEDEKRRFFITNKEWKHPDNFEISNSKNKANPYLVTATMDYEKIYSFNAGSKLFFEARLYPIFDEEIPENEKRIRDYYFTCPYQAMDTTVYKFPAGFSLETMPKNKSVQFPFAVYTCNYTWDAATHTLTSTALLQIKERVIKAADYTKLLDFKKQVMADVNEKIVMKRE
jgi:transglutaminase-like putative cysteine protease